jgi:hypothetical protein
VLDRKFSGSNCLVQSIEAQPEVPVLAFEIAGVENRYASEIIVENEW